MPTSLQNNHGPKFEALAAQTLTESQWTAYCNRSSHLLRHALNLKGSLAQIPRFGLSPGERRAGFANLTAEMAHLVPMMVGSAFRSCTSTPLALLLTP